jgi:hypothetical protein
LPKSINDLDDDQIISFDNSSVSTNINNNIQPQQQISDKKHQNQIRDSKRQSLAKTLETYELNIEENEYLYQEELLRLFEYDDELFEQQSDQIENFMNCLNNYLKHRTDKGIREIRYKETIFRRKLNHPRHRYSSSVTNRSVNVYPEVIIEVLGNHHHHHPFTGKELALLSSAGTNQISFLFSLLYIDRYFAYSIFRRTQLYKMQSKFSLS